MFLISEVIINKQIIWVVLPHCCFKQISGVIKFTEICQIYHFYERWPFLNYLLHLIHYTRMPFWEDMISIFLFITLLQSMLFSRGFLFRIWCSCKFLNMTQYKNQYIFSKFISILLDLTVALLTFLNISSTLTHRAWLFPGNALNFIMVKTIIATTKNPPQV